MNSQSKILIGAILAAIAIGLLVIFGGVGNGGDPDPRDPDVVDGSGELTPINFRLKWLIYSSFAPHLVAKEEGLHAAQGVEVTINPGGPGLDPIRLVASGVDDVGLASYDQILIAREKGIPLIAIAEDTVKSGVGFMALAESSIQTPQDFVGKKVGVMPGTDKGTMYEALMAKEGIDRSLITEIPVQFDLSVLFNGSVDVVPAFVTNQPIVARDLGFDVSVVDPWDYGIRPGGNVYFTSESTLEEKRTELIAFLRAELEAISLSQEMPTQEIVDITLKYNDRLTPTAEADIWEATKVILLDNDPDSVGYMSEETWQETARLFFDSGQLERIPNDYSEIFTNDLVIAAKEQQPND